LPDPNKKFELSDIIQKVFPKKAMTAFFFFQMQYKSELLKSNPDMKITEMAKSCGEKWKSLKDEEK